jgi:hypothetical protein
MSTDTETARMHRAAGLAAFALGDFVRALESFELALRVNPASGEYHYLAASAYRRLGEDRAAWKCCERALACDRNFLDAHLLMSEIALPGPRYLDILDRIHSHLRPASYLEIGVFQGASISKARPETLVVGVDPSPQIAYPMTLRTRIVQMTSDEYFANCDVRSDLGGLPIALAFVDGMHHFESALRDFIQIERHSTPSSTVLVHDCYPLDRLTAEREAKTTFWSGDVWKLVLALRKYRPGLSVNVIATAPTGLAVIRNLDPSSRALIGHYGDIVREFLALDYSVLDTDKAGMLALYPNDWERIKAILE